MKARSLKRFHFSFKTFALLFLCVTLLAGLLPENVSAASSIGLSAYAPRPGSGTLSISWNKVSNASFYAYSVRDTTTNASICDRTQTSKAYAKVSHTYRTRAFTRTPFAIRRRTHPFVIAPRPARPTRRSAIRGKPVTATACGRAPAARVMTRTTPARGITRE